MWFKVDDKLHDHGKTRKARKGGDRPKDAAAMGLWVLAGSWAAGNETDGFVPADELDTWDSDPLPLAERLVAAGYWHPAVVDGEEGYLFHEWEDYQPTREQLEAKRADARERMRRARDVRANTSSTSREVRSTRPDPTRPITNTPAADAAEPDPFDTWWAEYPRKTAKPAAAKAYAKARKDGATAGDLLDGLRNAVQGWQAAGTEARFIPHPATWLNQGRWADEVVLPDMPARELTRPPTLNQCDERENHPAHPWSDARNSFHCQGVAL